MMISNLPQNYFINFKGYTPTQICADLCKGACCNHGVPMSTNLKVIADKFCAGYKSLPDDLKSTVLIKTSIVKWAVNSDSVEVQTLNNLANSYIDAIARETDANKIKLLQEKLNKINKKLAELTQDDEVFLAITNPQLKNAPLSALSANGFNVCMFKDHGKTNLCTIYSGVVDDAGRTIERPTPCLEVGSDDMPCPWHHPEKYWELVSKTRAMFAQCGYAGLPQEVIQDYVAHQYNLNRVFVDKIWNPYLKTLDKTV